jgi:hypothetical protein
MISRRKIVSKAGSVMGLPFLLLMGAFLFQSNAGVLAKEDPVLTFQEFESSCIDLGHYDDKAKQLTVRFVNRNTERFYRYSKVPAEIWQRLKALNETGGVGEYLNETIVQHSEKFPYEELTIRSFKTIPKKKKAGDSK